MQGIFTVVATMKGTNVAKKQTVFFGVALYDGEMAGTVLDSIWKNAKAANRRVVALEKAIREDEEMCEEGGISVIKIDITKAK